MKIIIIEDEELAAEGLAIALKKIDKNIDIVAVLDSVKTAVTWFQQNLMPDLAFFDIQLADGLSFEIFDRTSVKCPVIFTTAYDEYALRAFKVNSIDYLLKPVSVEDLSKAFEKWQNLKNVPTNTPPQYSLSRDVVSPYLDEVAMRQMMQMMTQRIAMPQYKTRFMVKLGNICRLFLPMMLIFLWVKTKQCSFTIKTGKNMW